jgi:hypothetical protein
LQYQKHYCVSTMKSVDEIGVKETHEIDGKDYFSSNIGKSEEDPDSNSNDISPISMVVDSVKGSMYYIKYIDGMCQIKEIIPRRFEQKDHIVIFEMKADLCFGFGINSDSTQFYFIDELKQIQILVRIPDIKMLQEKVLMNVKDKDRLLLRINKDFQNIIIGE